MGKKTREHVASVLKEIKALVKPEVVKESRISDLCDMNTAHLIGFAVCLTLSTKYDYTRAVFEDWRERLEADDYVISVLRNQLRIRFDVPYSKTRQES